MKKQINECNYFTVFVELHCRRPPVCSQLFSPEIIIQKTILIKSPLGPLAQASYWLTLTSEFNPFLLICVSPHDCDSPASFCHVCSWWQLHGIFLTLPPSLSIQFSFAHLPMFCPAIGPKQFLY